MSHVLYILHSEKLNRFYTGETADLDVRMEFHKEALPHKFTAAAKDWKRYLTITCSSRVQALKIELHIKRMKSSAYIRNLKKYPEMSEKLLERYKS